MSLEAKFTLLTNLDWVMKAQIQVHGGRRTGGTHAVDEVRERGFDRCHCRNDGRPSLHCERFIIAVDRMRNQLIERSSVLDVEVSANEKFERSPIAAVELKLTWSVVRKSSIRVP